MKILLSLIRSHHFLSPAIQSCSPRDRGLGLETAWDRFLRSWSWSRSVGLELFFKTTYVFAEPISALPNANVKAILSNDQFKCLQRFVSRIYCVPAMSAPVERIFSHGGIFMHPHRACMSDSGLCNLVFAKCNAHMTDQYCDSEWFKTGP